MATVQGSQVSCGQGECGEGAGRGEEAEQEVGQGEGGGLRRGQAEVARQLRGAGRGQAEDDRRVGLPQAVQAGGRAQGPPGPGPEAAPGAQRGAGEVGPSSSKMSPYIYKRYSEDNSSLAEPVSSGQSQLKEKLLCVPANIAQSQKLLRTSIFQTPEPQFPTKCLILNIYKIKHQQLEVSTCN